MTPPPTMTTCARVGSSATVDHVLEEPLEAGAAEGRDGLLEPVHPPAAEVVVDRAGRSLDEAPQGPAVLTDQHLQPHPGEVGSGQGAEVGLGVRLDLVGGEVALGAGVADLEADV